MSRSQACSEGGQRSPRASQVLKSDFSHQATPAETQEVKEKEEPKKAIAPPKGGKKEAKVTNQFNFCERASQTFNNAVKVRGRGFATHCL